jgi:hypothetical protein
MIMATYDSQLAQVVSSKRIRSMRVLFISLPESPIVWESNPESDHLVVV